MTISQYFRVQIETVPPTTGDYLLGRTYDEALAELVKSRGTVISPVTFDRVTPEFDAKAHIDKRIAEYAAHAGERLLYFVVEHSPAHLEVLKIWESDLETLADTYEYSRHTGANTMPIFVPKQNED